MTRSFRSLVICADQEASEVVITLTALMNVIDPVLQICFNNDLRHLVSKLIHLMSAACKAWHKQRSGMDAFYASTKYE